MTQTPTAPDRTGAHEHPGPQPVDAAADHARGQEPGDPEPGEQRPAQPRAGCR